MSVQSLIEGFTDLIFQPGSSLKLVPLINIAIVSLILLLCCLGYYNTIDSIHIIILSILSVCLLITVNWFFYEYNKEIEKQKYHSEGKPITSSSSTTTTTTTAKKPIHNNQKTD